MAFITAETRSSIVELAMGMLNQAPSTALLNTLIAKSVEGASLQDLADYIATTDAFTAEYPATQTAREFATEMFGKLITGGTLDADINTAVIDLLEGLLIAGTTKAQGFVAVIEFLANPANASHPDLGDISQSFQNRADAAEYFSITKELGGSTDAELAAAIASVTSDAATLTAANEAAEASDVVAADAGLEEVVAGQTTRWVQRWATLLTRRWHRQTIWYTIRVVLLLHKFLPLQLKLCLCTTQHRCSIQTAALMGGLSDVYVNGGICIYRCRFYANR